MIASRFMPSPLCRRKATDRLHRGNTRLHLALACIVCLTFIIGTVYLADCVFCTIPRAEIRQESIIKYFLVDVTTGLIQVLLAVFLDLPLLFGTAMIFIGAAYDEDRPLSTVFCAFEGSRAYFRAIAIMLRLLIWPLLSIGLAALLVLATRVITDVLAVAILFFAASLLLLSTLLYGANDAVLPLAFCHPDTPIRQLFRESHAMTKGRRFSQLRFKLSYVGWALLGVVTLGLSLLFHTIPHSSLAYALFLQPNGDHIH